MTDFPFVRGGKIPPAALRWLTEVERNFPGATKDIIIIRAAGKRAETSLRNSVSAITRNAEGNDDNRAIAERQSNYDRSVETTETGAGGDRAVDEG